ncbi:Hypothetical protein NTJ_10711 [Nesidiocoris tenuis]|uniref:Fanconi anaemia group A protein N-terminal domain-containing protein n=1 Tax=Nesidiocoris tenuis TaxID=355587 RepID=A0ABN7B565_9HEMI|nr:Hypothetical protein NTJ_10711 [Nesidiocoris tenuis]
MNIEEVSLELLLRISKLRCHEFPDVLLNEKGSRMMADCMVDLKTECPRTRHFLKEWIHSDAEPPFEMVWRLNEEGIMFVTTYFYLRPSEVDRYSSAFETVYTASADPSVRSSACLVLASISVTFINTLMNYDETIQTFFKGATCKIVETALKLVDDRSMQGCYLADVLNSVFVFQECLYAFALLNLKTLLSYADEETSSYQILRTHSKKFTSRHLDVGISFFISKLLSLLRPETIVTELKSAQNLFPFKSKYFLAILSIFITERNEEAAPLVKGLIDEWLKKGLEDASGKEFLFLAVICARHCSAEKTKLFPSYIGWFGAAQPTNPNQFFTFFKFLSDLVPYEPPLYLKIHVNKVPSAPSGCQNVLSDYVALAKTRLDDMNETTDYLSIFNECYDTNEESLSADVAQLLNHFKTTNEIAKPILEASIFRRQYYEKIFLKYLLSVRASEDPLRGRLIQKMNAAGKIPPNMFSVWASL